MKNQFIRRFQSLFILSDNKIMVVLAVLIGVADGIAAALLINLILRVEFWTDVHAHIGHFSLERWVIIFVPALGGLLAGLTVQLFDHAAAKGGIVEVIYALRRRHGFLPTRLTVTKTFASAFTVGSGGSVGPEAPIAQIGGGVGSLFAHFRHLSPENRRTLVAAGAAGGLAAVFNTPMAAVIFAIEVLIKEFASQTFALIVLTTVTASITSHFLLGERSYFPMLSYSFNGPSELGFYFLLGLLCAPVAKLFQWFYYKSEDVFEHWNVTQAMKTMTGGFLVGLIAFFLPDILWDGHLVVDKLLTGNEVYVWPVISLLVLVLGKIVATSLTLGSGGSGGLLVPAMFMGAFTGVAFGRWVHWVSPLAAPPGAYGIVGMAAVLAGVTHAPFTAIMMLFELTSDYKIILPLMFTVGVTMIVARWLYPGGIEHRDLLRKGVPVRDRLELHVLDGYRAGDIMNPKVKSILADMPLAQLTEFIGQHPHTGFPVLNAQGELQGLLTYQELHLAFSSGKPLEPGVHASDIMRRSVPTIFPENSLTDVVHRMQTEEVDRVIVVDPLNPSRMVGIITRSDILGIYKNLLK